MCTLSNIYVLLRYWIFCRPYSYFATNFLHVHLVDSSSWCIDLLVQWIHHSKIRLFRPNIHKIYCAHTHTSQHKACNLCYVSEQCVFVHNNPIDTTQTERRCIPMVSEKSHTPLLRRLNPARRFDVDICTWLRENYWLPAGRRRMATGGTDIA